MNTFGKSIYSLGFLVLCAVAIAQTIELTDGRKFTEASIVGQSAQRVTIKHAGGLASVGKAILPASLRAQYPVREEAPAPAAPLVVKEETPKGGSTATEKLLPMPAQTLGEKADGLTPEKIKVLSAAMSGGQNYFATHYRPSDGTLNASLKFSDDPVPVEGWTGRWRLHGFATLRVYRSEQTSDLQRQADLRNNRELSAKQASRLIDQLMLVRAEVVAFELEVSGLGPGETPAVSVTMR